ncbi:MAG: hypothetical protein CVU53_04450, partial [Deltaproteobacteria bacterium HGW-Deltaproteobacteria-11]
FPGCKPYAQAIAKGEADINQCPPGGEEGIRKLADLLGREVKPLSAEHGVEKAKSLAVIDENLCIGCTLCHETAPGHFRTNDEAGVDFVFRQPETPDEDRLCRAAREACPIDAIQDDGLEFEHSKGGAA